MEEDDGTTQTVYYFVNDHLSSASVVTDASGTLLSENRYTPFGEVRDITGSLDPITETDFGFTGQRNLGGIGLMDYNARFYSPTLGRFIQPDSIVPGAGNPQSWNRYSYTSNNPIKYTDPSGHCNIIAMEKKKCPVKDIYNWWNIDRADNQPTPTPTLQPTPSVPRLINSCGVGAGDKCDTGKQTGNELVLSALRDRALDLGYEVFYTDYEASGALKTEQAEDIVEYMDPNATFDIYLAGHSAAADSLQLAIMLFLEQGGDPSRIKGIALLDPTQTASGYTEEEMMNIGNDLVNMFAEVIFGYASNEFYPDDRDEGTYDFPDALISLDNHFTYYWAYNHLQISVPGEVQDDVIEDFGW